jgi:polyisoprenoid-binding protein YceI
MESFMKRNFVKSTVLCLSALALMPSLAATEKYTFDPMHTQVLFHINHFGFSNPAGKWLVEGSLDLDKDKIMKSKVSATINIANMNTGIPELDKHLKSELFFDVAKFPTATFVSDKIDRVGSNKAVVHGTLTLHGVSKPIRLNVKLNKMGINPINNKFTAGFTASTKFKRSDFGLKALLPGLGDEVTLDIESEAVK